ncbi:hypothetical protein ACFOD9_05675 [Novosphingobium bradum]|uniref:REDY-like protein HapK n=1 Tax=Novosphingobium bradum TaxID=1737444 RepID=A0ABV7IP47_9SPHN
MARFLLIALNGPTGGEGDEQAYNTWYDEVHKGDLMKVAGAVSVRRFKVEAANRTDRPYVSVTEVEADSAEQVMASLQQNASSLSDKLDTSNSIFVLARELGA